MWIYQNNIAFNTSLVVVTGTTEYPDDDCKLVETSIEQNYKMLFGVTVLLFVLVNNLSPCFYPNEKYKVWHL